MTRGISDLVAIAAMVLLGEDVSDTFMAQGSYG
jgi:hypothetical protein